MNLSLLVLCLCLFNGVFGLETEHYRDNADPVDTAAIEHSGDPLELRYSEDNPETRYSEDNPETRYSGENPETRYSGENPEIEHPRAKPTDDPKNEIEKTYSFLGYDQNYDDDVDNRQVKVMEGDNITLDFPSIITRDHNIIWTFVSHHSYPSIVIKASDVYYDNVERFGDRLHVDPRTGSLTIRNITSTDSGLYYQHAFKSSPEKKPMRIFNVTVFERLSMPRVTGSTNCSSSSERSSVSKCVLLCSVMNVTHVSLSWYKGKSLLSSISVSDLNIRLSLLLEVEYQDTNTYRCVFNNLIINHTQHLNITQHCQQCPSPQQLYPLLGVLALLLIIFGICFYCCYARRTKTAPDHLVNSSITEMDSIR
ncbi:uncharacterized protein LOC130548285 isoform X1 [Triplophysa rosa]|uniref:uncharacterized protein LOC130548285 isoform X1 n=1 Tax=Triplophysa rosa TaxID=992332 RepID=UPI002546055E|nr:uncharacterized protein LOC130548285 isoform X1 [Triplophysa rosa]